jgi:uncharacterized protein (DUF1330 family)
MGDDKRAVGTHHIRPAFPGPMQSAIEKACTVWHAIVVSLPFDRGSQVMHSKFRMSLAMLAGAALGGAAIQAIHAQGKAPAYVITEVDVIDEAAFKEFSPKVGQTVQAAGGKYLTRGGKIIALEGQAPKRFVLSVFPSVEAAQAWRNGAGWKDLTPLREKAVKTRAFIAEGVAN